MAYRVGGGVVRGCTGVLWPFHPTPRLIYALMLSVKKLSPAPLPPWKKEAAHN